MKRLRFASLFALTLALARSASAATYTYTPIDGATDFWTTGANWNIAPLPGGLPGGSADTSLVFGPAGTFTNVLPLINTNTNDAVNFGLFTLNSLTLRGTGSDTAFASSTIFIEDGLNGVLSFVNNGPTGPTIALDASNGAGEGATVTYNVRHGMDFGSDVTFTGNGTATFNFSRSISGVGGLIKNGDSTLTFTSDAFNSYAGNTVLNGGTIRINGENNLGSGVNSVIFNGGRLATDKILSLGFGRTVTFTGNGTLHVDPFGVMTINGTMTGAGKLTKTGNGTLTLAAFAAGYSGPIEVLGGTLSFTEPLSLGDGSVTNTLTINNSTFRSDAFGIAVSPATRGISIVGTASLGGSMQIDGVISGTGGLNRVGFGEIILTGANTYQGPTTVTSGTLTVANTQALGVSTSPLQLAGGVLNLALDATGPAYNVNVTGLAEIRASRATLGEGFTYALGNLTLNGGSSLTISTGTNIAAGLAAISFGPSVTLTGAATLNADGTVLLGTVTGVDTNFTLGGAGTTSTIGQINIGAGTLFKAGTGTWTLNQQSNHTGGTTVQGGTLVAADSLALGAVTGPLTLAGGTLLLSTDTSIAPYNVVVTGNSTIQPNRATAGPGITHTFGGLTLSGGNLTIGTGGPNVVGGGSVVAFTTAGTITANSTLTSNGVLSLSGLIGTDSTLTIAGTSTTTTISGLSLGTGGLTKAGNGTATLLGGNVYSGLTTVSGGTLQYGAADAIGSGGLTVTGGTLAMGAFSDTVGAVSVTGGTITGTGTLTSTVGFDVQNGTVPVVLAGAVGLTKSAGGTVTLTGANLYTGPTTITGGTLKISAAENLGDATQATNTINLAGILNSSGGTYDLGAARVITLTGGGTIQTDAGVLTLSAAINNGANLLTVNGAGNTTITGVIGNGTGGLTKGGGGTLTLAGANTYTGNTTIGANSGTVIVANPLGLGTPNATGVIALNGSTLVFATDTSVAAYNLTYTGGTIQLNRATAGAGFTHTLGTLRIGNVTLAPTVGANVVSGASALQFSAVTLTGAPTFNATSAALILGNVTGPGANTNIILTGNYAGAASSIGAISNVGNGTITKTGTGKWILTGANVYNTAPTISAGILAFANSGSTGTANFTLNTAGAILEIGADAIKSGGVQVSGPIGLGKLLLGNGTIQAGGVARTIGNAVEMSGGTATVAGTVPITFSGTYTTTTSDTVLSVNNTGGTTFSGAFNIRSTTGNNRTVNMSGSGPLTFSGTITDGIAGATGSNINYIGTGTMTLASVNTFSGNGNYTGSGFGTIAGGNLSTVVFDGAHGGSGTNSGNVTVGGATSNAMLRVNGNYTIGLATTKFIAIRGGNGTTTGQGTLSLVDGTVNTLTINNPTAAATVLQFTNAAGTSNLSIEVSGSNSDQIVLGDGLKASVANGGVLVNVTAIGALTGGQQTILTAPGGLTIGASGFVLANTGNFGGRQLSLTTDGTHLFLNQGDAALTPGTAYWQGSKDGIWFTFTGGNANETNWATDVDGTLSHQVPGATSNVVFAVTGGGANLSTTLGADFSINSLTLGAENGPGKEVTIGGSKTLTILAGADNGNTPGNGITVAEGSGSHTITSNIALGAPQTWTVANDPAAALKVNGVISGGSNLTKSGAGTLVLGGSNTFTGGLTIQQGTVRLGNAAALNALAPQGLAFGVTALTNAILQVNGNSAIVGGIDSDAGGLTPVIENANASNGTLIISTSGNSTYRGAIRDGVGGGALALTKSGTGSQTLAGNSTYTGLTTVSNGALLVDGLLGTSLVHVNASVNNTTALLGGTGTIGSLVTIHTPTGLGRINEISAGTASTIGTLTLSAGLTLESGAIALFNVLDGGTSDLINITGGGLTLNSGVFLRVPAGLSTAHEYTLFNYTGADPLLNGLVFSDFSGTVLSPTYSFSATGGAFKLTITAATAAIPTLTLNGVTSGSRIMSGRALAISGVVGNSGIQPLNGTLTGDGNLAVTGLTPSSPVLVPGATVDYSGTLNTGLVLGTRSYGVKIADPAATPPSLSVTGTLDVLGNREVTPAVVAAFGSVHAGGSAISNALTLTSTGVDNQYTRVKVGNVGPDANGVSVTGGNVNLVFDGSTSDTRALNAAFTGAGPKNGTVTLVTTGEGLEGEAPINVQINYSAIVYSGKAVWGVAGDGAWLQAANWKDTHVDNLGGAGTPGVDGAVSAGDTATFGDVAGAPAAVTVNLDGTSPSLAGLKFNSTNITYTLATGTGGTIALQAGATVDVSTTLAPTISAGFTGVDLKKTGIGTLILTGTSANTGLTTVANGVIQLAGGDNRLSTTSALVLGDASGTSGKLILGNGAGLVNQTVGGLSAAGGTANSIVGGNEQNSIFTINSANAGTFGGRIGGTGTFENNLSLVKAGAGVLTLSGVNTYLGTTTLQGGAINMANSAALSTGQIVFAGGTLQFSAAVAGTLALTSRFTSTGNNAFSLDTNGNNVTLTGVLAASGNSGISKLGAGTLTLAENPTTTGATLVAGGVLQTSNVAALGNAAVRLIAAGNNRAVWQTNGVVERTLGGGGGATQLQWNTNSGFAAKGGTLTVTLNGGAAIKYGDVGFMGGGTQTMVFGSTTADNVVTLTNDVNLGPQDGYNRAFYVEKGLGTDRAVLTGRIGVETVAGAAVQKAGPGTLLLTNPNNNWTFATSVVEGTLIAGGNVPVTGTGVFGNPAVANATIRLGNADAGLGGLTTPAGASVALLIEGAFSIDRPINITNNANATSYSIGGNSANTASFTGGIAGDKAFSVVQSAGGLARFTGAITGTGNMTLNNVGGVEVTGAISGGRTVTKQNTGTAVFSGVNTYTGNTIISNGPLLLNGTTASATTLVNGTGLLGGGTLLQPAVLQGITVDAGGTFSPGGTLLTPLTGLGAMQSGSGALNLNGGSTSKIEFNSATLEIDHIFGVGALNLSLGNDAALSLTDLGGNQPLAPGTTFEFIRYTAWNGGFFTVNGTPIADDTLFTAAGYQFTLDYNYFNGTGVSAALIVVPEPASVAMLCGGLGLLLAARRRRK